VSGAQGSKASPRPHRIPRVRVPDLVGESQSAAKAQLAGRNLKTRFREPLVGPSCGVSPSDLGAARVIYQAPLAGTHTQVRRSIEVWSNPLTQVRCTQSLAARACPPSDLSLRLGLGSPDYAGGSYAEAVTAKVIHRRGSPPCSVSSPITLSIEQPQGVINERIIANPTRAYLHYVLGQGDAVIAEWVIQTWCGSESGVAATASYQKLTATKSFESVPNSEPWQHHCPFLRPFVLGVRHG
jgi:hypothetical protein